VRHFAAVTFSKLDAYNFIAVCACAAGTAAPAVEQAPAAAPLVVSEARTLAREGGRNPTLASDRRSGAVYLAWAQEIPGTARKDTDGKKTDPTLEVRVARSDDGGRSFGPPVVASRPEDRVKSFTVSPTQVAVGPKGEVYVLYEHHDPDFKRPGWEWGRSVLRLVRSEDGGKRFSAPVEIGTESVEGVQTASACSTSSRPPTAISTPPSSTTARTSPIGSRTARSPEGPGAAHAIAHGPLHGRRTALRAEHPGSKPTCGCCGTKVAQGIEGPLYATTRGQSKELKGSVDAVRDHFVAVSRDGGTSWSEPVKFHDDRFKISGCPDISPGLAVDSKGRLHAAWYTGTERHPGVFYARSDDEGRGFSKPIALLSDDWIPYGDVKLALDTRDNAWVAFEDRRGDEDLIQVARIAPDGRHTLAEVWPGTAPDVAVEGDTAIVAWGTKEQGEEEASGGINMRVLSLPGSP
jgi:hypothetical protein